MHLDNKVKATIVVLQNESSGPAIDLTSDSLPHDIPETVHALGGQGLAASSSAPPVLPRLDTVAWSQASADPLDPPGPAWHRAPHNTTHNSQLVLANSNSAGARPTWEHLTLSYKSSFPTLVRGHHIISRPLPVCVVTVSGLCSARHRCFDSFSHSQPTS
jgi:hypothetical protein